MFKSWTRDHCRFYFHRENEASISPETGTGRLDIAAGTRNDRLSTGPLKISVISVSPLNPRACTAFKALFPIY